MKPLTHLFLGGIFSLIFSLIFKINFLEFLVLFLSTWFFIDLDLVFIFVVKEKSINPFKFIEWHKKLRKKFLSLPLEERKENKLLLRFLHSIEFILLLFLFYFFNKIFLFVIIGFIFHLILDWIDLFFNFKEGLFHKISLFLTLKKNKNRKKLIY